MERAAWGTSLVIPDWNARVDIAEHGTTIHAADQDVRRRLQRAVQALCYMA